MENYWCAARLMSRREAYATHCLGVAGFTTYLPRLREQRTIRGRRVVVELQWHAARWCPGILAIIMDGVTPARVPDHIITEIRSRERGDLIELPKPPGLARGDRVRITSGAFADHLAIYQGQTAHDRVAVLLQLLGGRQRTELPASAIERVGALS
jgi:transcriptional antiterminator RfaH